MSRRAVLAGALATGGLWLVPGLARAGAEEDRRRVLVLLHLRGGNDGLNTVVPLGERRYRRLRPTLAVPADLALPLHPGVGLHPALGALHALWGAGRLAVVNGVGYPEPDLSHFRSTEIWYTAEPARVGREGWIARALAAHPAPGRVSAAAVDREAPLLLHGGRGDALTLQDFEAFRLPPDLAGIEALYADAAGADGARALVGRAGTDALSVARRIAALAPAKGAFRGRLGEDLARATALLEAEIGLAVLHLAFDGFDTHANQAGAHARLLGELGDNLAAFDAALEARALAGRVVTVVYSEFGRRPEENASAGTDHGTAGPVLVVGGAVRGGLYGRVPSLEDLDADENLVPTTDFRRLYATLLRDALRIDPTPIVGAHEPLEMLA